MLVVVFVADQIISVILIRSKIKWLIKAFVAMKEKSLNFLNVLVVHRCTVKHGYIFSNKYLLYHSHT